MLNMSEPNKSLEEDRPNRNRVPVYVPVPDPAGGLRLEIVEMDRPG